MQGMAKCAPWATGGPLLTCCLKMRTRQTARMTQNKNKAKRVLSASTNMVDSCQLLLFLFIYNSNTNTGVEKLSPYGEGLLTLLLCKKCFWSVVNPILPTHFAFLRDFWHCTGEMYQTTITKPLSKITSIYNHSYCAEKFFFSFIIQQSQSLSSPPPFITNSSGFSPLLPSASKPSIICTHCRSPQL